MTAGIMSAIASFLKTVCSWASKQAAYVYQLEDKVDDLKTAVQELGEIKEDVKRKISLHEGPQVKALDQVNGWVSRAETKISEAEDLIKEAPREIEKLCLGGFISSNCISSYGFGKQVAKKLEAVEALKVEGKEFKDPTEKVPEERMHKRPGEPTLGLKDMLDKVWSYFETNQVGILGIHGQGGIGKTTILKRINNEFCKIKGDFDVIIWITVSKDLNLEKIQEGIGKQIGFSDEWIKDSRRREDKAGEIYDALGSKKFVLLLDDIWERVDLVSIGVPLPQEESKTNKIIFTTRSEQVCGEMSPDQSIKVQPLSLEESWKLFAKMAGQVTSDPDIQPIAKAVAEECKGLPLALLVIGRVMACRRTQEEWRDALYDLKRSPANLKGMKEEVFARLKYSYDKLLDDRERSCFLYCALFPEDFEIPKEELIDYWICEKFWGDYGEGNSARDKGYTIIGTLINACLLEYADDGYVKMHDVIRDMALWIACEHDKAKENYLVQAGVQLIEAPDVEKWKGVRRVSLMVNYIEELKEVPDCPDILTLLLRYNRVLDYIGDDFFRSMKALTVLDLSKNSITELPRGISNLLSLQYLNLSSTDIRSLPSGLKKLKSLKYMNLENTYFLELLPRRLISCLSRLQVLRMWDSALLNDENTATGIMEDLQSLKDLTVLTISITNINVLESFCRFQKLLLSTHSLKIASLRNKSLDISFVAKMGNLGMLEIDGCAGLEELNVDRMIEGTRKPKPSSFHGSAIVRERSFNSLHTVRLDDCVDLKHLTWLTLAPNLKRLEVRGCPSLEEIISAEKIGEVLDVGEDLKPFAKLEFLDFFFLEELKSIHWKPLPCQSLKTIKVFMCPLLKKLPLNSQSAQGSEFIITAPEWWWNNLEWEDQSAREALQPRFQSIFWLLRSSIC